MNPAITMIGAIYVMLSAMSWALIDGPILAPITTPSAFADVMTFAFTRPTRITDVAVDDWRMVVSNVPLNTPRSGVEVQLSSIALSLSPATRWIWWLNF